MPNEFWTEMEKKSNKDEAAVNAELKKAYEAAYKDIQGKVEAFMKDHPNMTYVESQQLSRMKSLETQIKDALNKLYGEVRSMAYEQDLKEAEYGYFGEWYNIENQLQANVSFGMLDDAKIKKLIEMPVDGIPLSKRLYGSLLGDTQKAINEVLKEGLIQGYDNRKMARRLQDTTNVSYRKAKTIIRTESGRVNSMARQEAMDEAARHGVEGQKRWISTLDRKTRHSHAVLDGQIVGKDEEFETLDGSRAMMPRMFGIAAEDINCRCGCTSVIAGFVQTRRRDGETKKLVKTDNYESWLKKNHPDDHKKFAEQKALVMKKAKVKVTAAPPAPTPTVGDLNTQNNDIKAQLGALESKTYSKLFVRPVTPADYERFASDGSFQHKKNMLLDMLNSDKSSDHQKDYAKKLLTSMNEFQNDGKTYITLKAELADILKQIKELGGALPIETPTLSKLADHQKSFMDAHMKEMLEYIKPNQVPEVQKALEKVVNENDLMMRVRPETLKVIQSTDKRFKTQIELKTGDSGGSYDPDERVRASMKMFGFGKGDVPSDNYEKYGYIGNIKGDDDAFGPKQYGSVSVVFKKEDLWDRATFTYEDSLQNGIEGNVVPAKLNDPKNYLTAIDAYDSSVLQSRSQKHGVNLDAYNSRTSYFEAQFHGDVTMDNVEAVVFNKASEYRNYPENLITDLKSSGVKVYVRDAIGELYEP